MTGPGLNYWSQHGKHLIGTRIVISRGPTTGTDISSSFKGIFLYV